MAVDLHFRNEDIRITISVLLICLKVNTTIFAVIMKVNTCIHCGNSAIGHLLNTVYII